MTQSPGRIACPRCGANNFDNVAACWKCQAALGGAGVPARHATAPTERSVVFPTVSTPAVATGDPGVARRAAIALALMLPFIGLPVGWIFMMIEDERRQAIGRICAVWSLVSLVLQLLLMFACAQAVGPWMNTLVATAARAAQPQQLPGGGAGAP